MAGIASSLLSHLSSVLNSSSTVFTMDLYKPVIARSGDEGALVRVGRWSAFGILALATALAIWLSQGQHRVFTLIQNVGAWVASPIAAVFLLGVLWKRATSAAATFVLIFGFPYTWLVEYVLFRKVPWLMPFDNWLNRTFLVWITCMVLIVVISLMTKAPDPDRIGGIIWSPAQAKLPESERERNRGLRNLFLWWAVFIGMMAALYAYLIWFQFWGAGAATV
jgi:SSS family solute:Na+ symporter